ncbi:MAG TPA: sigma-54 dependent transcriptional regulator [Terriglobia bacterium]|nr:sigma-54 dependent transcriptional regulator [Terriglobia bacterium]
MSTVQGRILIADDEHEMAQLLGHLVHREGLTPLLAKDGTEALQLVRAGDPDVLLADIRMPGMDGMELMRKAKELDPELPVILITGFAEVRGAVEALRVGAHDYLAKPFEHQQVIRVVLRALNERRLKLELKHLADHVHHVLSPREMFGPSKAIGRVISAIEQVAKSNFSVVIVGETGSGKEVVARAIHYASGRARRPFVPVDCGAVPEMLIESTLFGHERGAFTGADQQTVGTIEVANTGTLFLDEISNLPLTSQSKLLRVLQEKTLCRVGGTKPIHMDARVLTASGHPLEALCERGSFRPDLYFRLNEYTISIPPLRERREDIPYLAKRFMDIANIEISRSIKGFSPSAIEAMLTYRWPGNVRQLQSAVRRAVLMAEDTITEGHLGLRLDECKPLAEDELVARSSTPDRGWDDLPLREIVRRQTVHVERMVIVHALRRTGGNKAKAARLLQVDYKTLHSKVKAYGIQSEGEQPNDQETQ